MNIPARPRRLLPGLAVLALAFCWGCAPRTTVSTSNAVEDDRIKPSQKLVPAQNTRLKDIPVPLGARFKGESSRSYQTGSSRRAEHTYGIWAKRSLIRDFYQDNMPVHRWKLTNSFMLEGLHCLNYTKAGESCRITIGPTNWYFQNLIHILVQPVDKRSPTSK